MNQVNSENGSNSSNGGGSGNNSDNSALVSLGNTSFGFNFDSEEGGSNSDRNSDRNSNNSEEGDSDGSNQGGNGKLKAGEAAKVAKSESSSDRTSKLNAGTSSHSDAAARAVAGLESIANESSAKETSGDGTFCGSCGLSFRFVFLALQDLIPSFFRFCDLQVNVL
jgi:hypothetical protein